MLKRFTKKAETEKLLLEGQLIDKSSIEGYFAERGAGLGLHLYETTDSTNKRASEYAKNMYETDDERRIRELFVAEQQTEGRGRLGRHWESPMGTGIWMSLMMNPDIDAEHISEITLLAGVSVIMAIRDYACEHSISKPVNCMNSSDSMGFENGKELFNLDSIRIKWPNDVVINGKKVCGILSELVYGSFVISGIGINVNNEAFDTEKCAYATSLFLESKEKWNRTELICRVSEYLISYISELEKNENIGFIKDTYNKLLVSIDQEVRLIPVTSDNEAYDERNEKYISRGIDDTGALIVENEQGEVRRVTSGEVSVRGLYGYV